MTKQSSPLDRRPVVVALAGSNGAGKTTFYHSQLSIAALRFVNADDLAAALDLDAKDAMDVASELRTQLLERQESFIFETVFSDPVGDKLDFLIHAAEMGYTVILCFIGLAGPKISEERVAMRVSQGGHDVPPDRLVSRFHRTLANLKGGIRKLPHVWIFDNSDLNHPFRRIAVFEKGEPIFLAQPVPKWLRRILP